MGILSKFSRTKYDDDRLVKRVQAAIDGDPLLPASSDVIVASKKGVVSLTGTVHKQPEMDRIEGAIVRTLGLIERRGFTVTGISTATGESEHQMEMTLELSTAGRSVEVLARQVARLFDVSSVSFAEQGASTMRLEESLAC